MSTVKSIQLPIDVVAALFEFAGRGRLDREEWKFLEHWEATVKQGIAQASAPQPAADVQIDPPYDPNTEEAEKKREKRRERRKAEATRKVVKEAGTSALVDETVVEGDGQPRPEGPRDTDDKAA